MFNKNHQIKRFPFLGYSKNIMEYFAIIGYQENFFPKIIDSYKKKFNEYPPTILSSVTSNTDYGIVNNRLIISQIYPKNPIVLVKNNNDKNEYLSTSNVVYSFCFDSTDGKEKIFYVCFGFRFYEKYKYSITSKYYGEYYIPKAFCIISQYYYFTLFEYICKNIYELFNKREKEMMPIESIIYNIVNFIPSPINYSLNLNIFNNNEDNIEIGQLSGYPYIDFDLRQIFDLLPLYLFLEIYMFTILEQSMIFFSSNLEILNMVMFIFYVLNYPCNDSTYFWHIVSVSENNLIDENKFVSKIMDSMIGVNSTYNDKIDTYSFGKYHYIVDIDNKKIFLRQTSRFSNAEDFEDFNKLKNLYEYIQNIIRDKDKYLDSIFLKSFIERLRRYLEKLLLEKNELNFNFNPKNKYVNFFKSSKEILKQNRNIQELFYDFFLNILMIFYQDNSLDSSFDKIKRDKLENINKRINKLLKIDNNLQMNENEKYFCELFRNTMKYKIYFENFIINFETVNVYTIPLYFSEEFLNIKSKDASNTFINQLSLFYIIDSLYYPKKNQTQNINLNKIFSSCKEKFKKFFKFANNIDNDKVIVLNKKILNKYIFILKNNFKKQELINLFSSIGMQQDNHIIFIDKRNIYNIIQNKFEIKNFIDITDYLIFSLVYILAISIPLHSYLNMVNYLEKIISLVSETKIFLRQNIYVLIKSIYKFYIINKRKNIFPNLTLLSIRMYYYMIVNILIQNNIIPNEEMMTILEHIFGKLINQEKDIIQIDDQLDDESNFKIEKNKNFLCFMKHCFTSKKIIKPNTMIKAAMKETNSCNIIIRGGKKQLHPTVEIKINEFSHSSYFFSPKKIYKIIQSIFNESFDNDNDDIDMNQLTIQNIRDVISNLILYTWKLNKYHKFSEFLIRTLYLYRNQEKIYGIKKNEEY